ncbi:MAG: hypothetical protein JST26_02030 [Bacteroidetes bacterium]|nr:hypothetical protein [Bacteroidota bacterium]
MLNTGCQSGDTAKQEGALFDSLATPKKYFTVLVHEGGKTSGFEFSQDAWVDSAHFQNFLNIYYGKPAAFDTVYTDDVTGDGIADSIHFHVAKVDGDYTAWSGIRSKGKTVFGDTIMLDRDFEAMYFGVDSIPKTIEPYMSLYICYTLKDFVQDWKPADMSMEDIRAFFFNFLDNKADTLYWREDLKRYKGKLVGNISFMDGDSYIWDERKQAFLLFYSP